MFFPFYISKKFIFSKKDSRFLNFISSIAIAGIALGVATLIIALSILSGFEKTITSKIVDFDSHIKIDSYEAFTTDWSSDYKYINSLLPSKSNVSYHLANLAVVSYKGVSEGLTIKGIVPSNNTIKLDQDIIEGKSKLDDHNNMVIGKKLANKLNLKVNDKITVFALKGNEVPNIDNLPNIVKYNVSGIFETGMSEYDDMTAYINFYSAQKLFSTGNSITGFDIMLNNPAYIDSIEKVLNDNLRYPYSARSIYKTHKSIFTWIDLQKKPIPIILGLIIIVAVFNIVGTLLMMVLEKITSIGILRSIGLKRRKVISIFLLHGGFVSIIGILFGNILAYTLMIMQLKYNIITLPSSVYFMSAVPIDIKIDTFLLISGITFLLSLAASFIPSFIASKIQPVNALRFE